MNILKLNEEGKYVVSEECAETWMKDIMPHTDDCPMCSKSIWLKAISWKACESCGLIFKLKLGDLL